jgi:hypothetical protein
MPRIIDYCEGFAEKKFSAIMTCMQGTASRRVLTSLQMVSMAMLVGVSLYIYNDWRVHRTSAAPATETSGSQKSPSTGGNPKDDTPLDLGDQGVSGPVEVGPDGTIHPTDGSKDIPGQRARKP